MAVRVGLRPQLPAPGPQVIQEKEARVRCWGWLESMAPSKGQPPLSSNQFSTFFLKKKKHSSVYGKSLHCSALAYNGKFSQTLCRQTKCKQNRATEQLRLAGMSLQSSAPPRSCRKEAAWPGRMLSWAAPLGPFHVHRKPTLWTAGRGDWVLCCELVTIRIVSLKNKVERDTARPVILTPFVEESDIPASPACTLFHIT